MKKEFVVKSIDAAPDGSPYVVVSLSSLKDVNEGNASPMSPFGQQPKMMEFTDMNDMIKDISKMFTGMGGSAGLTQIKIDMHEYKDMGLSVGDKVFLELTKAEMLGI